MAEIFVSYRRDDTGILCERVTSRLSARFGERRVFRDANAIYIGSSWEQVLHTALQDCYVVIALIGVNWLSARDAQGRQRLFDPQDFVRMELVTALAQHKRIIPVLANGARMPKAHELPPDLAPLAQLLPLLLRPDPYFDSDMQAIMRVAEPGVRKRVPHRAIALCGIMGLLSLAPTIALGAAGSDVNELILFLGLFSPALGCILVILRSIQTRAWMWLALASLIVVSMLASGAWLGATLAGKSTVPHTTENVALTLVAVISLVLAVVLTLAFGFFGPRRLAAVQANQRLLRLLRWVVGACASVAGLLLAVVTFMGALNIDAPDFYFFTQIVTLLLACAGVGLALLGSLSQGHWAWVASLTVAEALLLIGAWVWYVDTLSDTVVWGVFCVAVAGGVAALDRFTLGGGGALSAT
ncbi:MAG TPA: toll/interleukin-1 receptor domain-containing protein [Ktedonobacterales bacterium]|nr:toll/interleukin-1 receptor domain-containing protein [Ktedonobacterales bacterium]